MVLIFLSLLIGVTAYQNNLGGTEGQTRIEHKVYCQHPFAPRFTMALMVHFKNHNAESVIDFTWNTDRYTKSIRKYNVDIEGYFAHNVSAKQSLDLSQPIDLDKKYDWVLSLDVGEHLPKAVENIYLENLIRHCKQGIILSWTTPNEKNACHINARHNGYIKQKLAEYGFQNELKSEKLIRRMCGAERFKNSVMVFRKEVE